MSVLMPLRTTSTYSVFSYEISCVCSPENEWQYPACVSISQYTPMPPSIEEPTVTQFSNESSFVTDDPLSKPTWWPQTAELLPDEPIWYAPQRSPIHLRSPRTVFH